MDVRLPDGTIVRNVPEGTTQSELIGVLEKNGHDVSSLRSHSAMSPKDSAKAAGAALPKLARAGLSIAQGPTFGFSDEIGGALGAAFGAGQGASFGERYRHNRDVLRGGAEKFEQEHPVLALGGQVAASLPLGGPLRAASALLPAATTGLQTVRNASFVGAGLGALGGAGNAAEMGDVAGGAGLGAITGGVMGGALSGVGQVAGAGMRNMRARVDRPEAGASGGGIPALLRGAVAGNEADELAKQRLAAALARDGRSTGQVGARLSTLGDDARLAVGAGKNTFDLLDTVATMPGRTGDDVERAIRAQQAGRGGRLTAVAEQKLGTGGARLHDTVEALIEQRSRDSAPLYERLRQVTLEADDDLAKLVQRAQSQGADKIARAIAETRGAPFSLSTVTGSKPGTLGVGTSPGSKVSMSDLDYLKEGLDDLIKKQTDAAGNISRQGLALQDLRSKLLAKLDDATGGLYKQARDAYAGPSALIDAAEAGKRAMRMDDVGIRGITAGMTQSELEAFRVGAFESIRAKVGREGGQTELLKMWKEPATQEKLRALFPDIRSYREFAAEVAKEARKKGLETVGRGSQTASRQARMDDEGAAFLRNAAGLGVALKTGDPIGLVSGARTLYGRTVMPEPVRDRIGSMLMQQGPQAQGVLGDLSRYVDQEQARRATQAVRGGLLGGATINSLLGQ